MKKSKWLLGTGVAAVYGLLIVNYFDLTPHPYLDGYQLWLFAVYFAPAIVLGGLVFRNLALLLFMGVLASLMNDLFYGPMAILYHVDLVTGMDAPATYLSRFYVGQFGFGGGGLDFEYEAYFFQIPISSSMMAASIVARTGGSVALYLRYGRGRKEGRASEKRH